MRKYLYFVGLNQNRFVYVVAENAHQTLMIACFYGVVFIDFSNLTPCHEGECFLELGTILYCPVEERS